ncbi:AbiH family protein [Bacteroides acidifaciens]|uniref:AbiH family protein n=1 Tax=Bacteroides acidifaciens TaxID=85831 RepID=UPI0025A968F2|nr:AbiH family protein [Bacteroides acidifaciens]
MKILFVLGNGFDIKLGLNTKYKNFYDSYLKMESSCDAVKELKQNISSEYQDWADLELGLGKYTEHFEDIQDGLTVYKDILCGLQNYLSQEESKYNYDNGESDKILSDLFHPENYLRWREKQNVFSHFNKDENWDVRVITFNYTKTLEKVLGSPALPVNISFENEGPRNLTHIVHIHGFVGERMILGVNDPSQIKNKTWQSNSRFLRRYVKPQHNDTYKLDHERLASELISNSHVICLFGVSIGDTDKLWWKKIADRVNASSSIRLIIFYFINDFEPIGNYGPEYEDNVDMVKDKFISAAGYNLDHNIRNQIYVTFQKSIFNFKVSPISQ